MIGSSHRARAAAVVASRDVQPDPRELDGGPPLDPGSPFLRDSAEARRRQARDGRSGRHFVRAALSWLAALAIVALGIYGGFWFTGYRLAAEGKLAIGDATLIPTTVSVPSPGAGQVIRVLARPSEEVAQGAPLFEVRVFGSDAQGRLQSSIAVVHAPVPGVVSAVLQPTGNAVRPGQAVVQMYDPASERFEVNVDETTLSRLRRGMRATLRAPGVSEPIEAAVDHVVTTPPPSAAQDPLASAAPEAGAITVVLYPLDRRAIRNLLPGIRFDTTVDTRSASHGAPSLLEAASP